MTELGDMLEQACKHKDMTLYTAGVTMTTFRFLVEKIKEGE